MSLIFPMNTAPSGDEMLTENDAGNILEQLAEAQKHAHLLGLMLEISPWDVEAIQKKHKEPIDKLYDIILAFLRQPEPPPTWRAIVNALKSTIVNLTALAKRVEAAHFPDPTASRDPPTIAVKPTTSGKSAQISGGSSGVGGGGGLRGLQPPVSESSSAANVCLNTPTSLLMNAASGLCNSVYYT